MANVLITDLLEESAYLIRSLLRGRGHNASIAICAAEARAKLDTGLFDTLFVDLCEPNADSVGVIRYANDLLPGLPTVVLTTESIEDQIQGVEIFGKVYRPIRGSSINETTERAIKFAQNLGARRSLPRKSVDFPLEITIGNDSFTAQATDLSPRGIALDGGSEVFTAERLNRLASLTDSDRVQVVLRPTKKEAYPVEGRIAFVDTQRKYRGKMIGMIFDGLDEKGQAYVDNLFADPSQAQATGTAEAAEQVSLAA